MKPGTLLCAGDEAALVGEIGRKGCVRSVCFQPVFSAFCASTHSVLTTAARGRQFLFIDEETKLQKSG